MPQKTAASPERRSTGRRFNAPRAGSTAIPTSAARLRRLLRMVLRLEMPERRAATTTMLRSSLLAVGRAAWHVAWESEAGTMDMVRA